MKKKVKSLLTDDFTKCYLCGFTNGLELHHCWHGTANRKLADEDGLVVPLCNNCHHKRLHDNPNKTLDHNLMKIAEQAWLDHNNAEISDFIRRYGENIL